MPPRRLKVGPHRYAVECSTDLLFHGDRRGSTDVDRHRIIVASDLAPSLTRETVLHELLHALWDTTPLRLEPISKREEDVVTALAPPLLDTLRRNPKLVAYLTTEE